MQQIITGTQQAQQAIHDGNEHGIINNHSLSLTVALTRSGEWESQKNATAVCCDLVTLQAKRFSRSQKTTVPDGNEKGHIRQIPCISCCNEGKKTIGPVSRGACKGSSSRFQV